MWCANCRKNVTGMISPTGKNLCCSRCAQALAGEMLAVELVEAVPPATPLATEATAQPTADAPLPCPADGNPRAPLPCPAPVAGDIEAAAVDDTQAARGERGLPDFEFDGTVPLTEEPQPAAHASTVKATARTANQPPPTYTKPVEREPLSKIESWEFDEDLLHMQRLLRRFDEAATRSEAATAAPPPALPRETHLIAALSRFVAGLALLAGMTALACGIALLAWSWRGQRPDLFMPGLLSAVGGQCGLLLGLALRPSPTSVHNASPATAAEPTTLLTNLGGDTGRYARIDRARR